VTQYMGL